MDTKSKVLNKGAYAQLHRYTFCHSGKHEEMFLCNLYYSNLEKDNV